MSLFSLSSISQSANYSIDPFTLDESVSLSSNVWKNTSGLVSSSFFPDPTKKTLCLIVNGQSNWTSVNPTLYVPSASVFQLNICDGAIYPISGKILGCSDDSPGGYGPGNPAARLADKLLIANGGTFDNVILCCIAVGGSLISTLSTGALGNRPAIAMKRFAARGITPSTTGVTFAYLLGQGEGDNTAGTTSLAYQASAGTMFTNLDAAGFVGRKFVAIETMSSGTTSSTIRAAQSALANGTTIFNAGDLDTLTGTTNRYGDLTHFNDVGAPAAAGLVYSGMHATGTPF